MLHRVSRDGLDLPGDLGDVILEEATYEAASIGDSGSQQQAGSLDSTACDDERPRAYGRGKPRPRTDFNSLTMRAVRATVDPDHRRIEQHGHIRGPTELPVPEQAEVASTKGRPLRKSNTQLLGRE
jgi:hypothetical protein